MNNQFVVQIYPQIIKSKNISCKKGFCFSPLFLVESNICYYQIKKIYKKIWII